MLDNIIDNDKAKFMTSYSKLANELDNFTLLNKSNKQTPTQIANKQNFLRKDNRINFILGERLKNNKQEAKNILTGKLNNNIIRLCD